MNKLIHNIDIDKDICNDFIALNGKYNFINSPTITDKNEYKTMFMRIVNDKQCVPKRNVNCVIKSANQAENTDTLGNIKSILM